MGNIYHANMNQKKARVAILLRKVDSKRNKISEQRASPREQGHFTEINKKKVIQQENRTILIIYAP